MYNRWSSTSTWPAELDDTVANDHAIDSSLPIYPNAEAIWDTSSSSAHPSGSTGPFTPKSMKSGADAAVSRQSEDKASQRRRTDRSHP
jgi:hypothetical protein